MFLSLIFELFWCWTYLKSPYLFPAMAAIPYYFGLDRGSLDLMTAFPLSCYYVVQELRAGRRPSRPETMSVELIRWLIVLSAWSSEDSRLAMAGYCYSILMTIMLEGCNVTTQRQIEVKYAWYLFWSGRLLWSGLPLGMVLHLLNFVAEFRLASLPRGDHNPGTRASSLAAMTRSNFETVITK